MNKRFLKNTAWIIGGKIIQYGISFVVGIFTASYLGPSNYGILGYINSVILMFTAFANLGLGNYIVKEIIEHKGEEGKIVGTAITLQIIFSIIAYVFVNVTIIACNVGDEIMCFCSMIQGFSLVLQFSDNINYYYQSKLESKIPTIISLVAYIIVQIYKIILLVTKANVTLFALAYALDYLVIAIFMILSYVVRKGPKIGFSKSIAKRLLKQSIPFVFAGTISVLYSSLDKIMLKEMLATTEAVGYYNVAHSIALVWCFVVGAFITSFAPLIYEAVHKEGTESKLYKTRLGQMYFVVFWLGVMASICIDIISPFLIKYAYGESYKAAIIPTIILTWAGIFSYLGVARGIQFVCEGKQKYFAILATMTVVVNVLMNYFLIPILQTSGATIATVVSEFFVCIIAPLLFKNTRNVSVSILQGIVGIGINLKELIKQIKNRIKSKSEPQKTLEIAENSKEDNVEEIENPINETENICEVNQQDDINKTEYSIVDTIQNETLLENEVNSETGKEKTENGEE